jgi:hypothetical protein
MGVALSSVTSLANLPSAHELAIPVEPALSRLFPGAGLRRGQVVGCAGDAALTLGCALAVRAVGDGAWLAVVGIPDFGIEAAVDLGIAPERMVAIEATSAADWGDRVVAAADGFELILTSPPPGAERAMRKLRQRLQARGSVMIAVRSTLHTVGGVACDVEIATTAVEWVGIGCGHGRLAARRVAIRSSGRRIPRPVALECWLPGPDGRVDVVQTGRPEQLMEHEQAS